MKVQAAVKKETAFIAISTAAGTLLMFVVFWLLHLASPDSIPFDYRVILGGVLGTVVAVANFFFMGLTVQKVTSSATEDGAYQAMKASYRFRTLGQLLWIVLALIIPVINGAAAIVPLFLPNICIKIRGIMGLRKA